MPRKLTDGQLHAITTLLGLGWKPDQVAAHIPCSVHAVRKVKRTLATTNTPREPKKKRNCMLGGVIGEVSFLLPIHRDANLLGYQAASLRSA
jgi:hypothetical protein